MIRKAIPKSVRFEVFKRDSFTCQYCGNKAPDVVLHIDHIKPISKGGDQEDITNLITSCESCNMGKGAKELSDDAVVSKRKKQLDELQKRREQLEMMVEWHTSLIDLDKISIDKAVDFWNAFIYPYFSLNENGITTVKNLVTKYGISETLECMRISANQYIKSDDEDEDKDLLNTSSMKALDYVEKIIKCRRVFSKKPYMNDLYYIRGILRNRFGRDFKREGYIINTLEKAYNKGADIDQLRIMAIDADNYHEWAENMETVLSQEIK